MVGERAALLETEQGSLLPFIGSSLIIYHSPLHPHTRFHPCTGPQSRIVQYPRPDLVIIIGIHTRLRGGPVVYICYVMLTPIFTVLGPDYGR